MTSTQPANITHGFKVCDVSSMESHACTVLRKPIQVCSHLDSAGLTKWRTLAATPGDRGPEDPEV